MPLLFASPCDGVPNSWRVRLRGREETRVWLGGLTARLMGADRVTTYRRACAHAATICFALQWDSKLLASSDTREGGGAGLVRSINGEFDGR